MLSLRMVARADEDQYPQVQGAPFYIEPNRDEFPNPGAPAGRARFGVYRKKKMPLPVTSCREHSSEKDAPCQWSSDEEKKEKKEKILSLPRLSLKR